MRCSFDFDCASPVSARMCPLVCVCDMSVCCHRDPGPCRLLFCGEHLHCACWERDAEKPDPVHLCLLGCATGVFAWILMDCGLCTSVSAILTARTTRRGMALVGVLIAWMKIIANAPTTYSHYIACSAFRNPCGHLLDQLGPVVGRCRDASVGTLVNDVVRDRPMMSQSYNQGLLAGFELIRHGPVQKHIANSQGQSRHAVHQCHHASDDPFWPCCPPSKTLKRFAPPRCLLSWPLILGFSCTVLCFKVLQTTYNAAHHV